MCRLLRQVPDIDIVGECGDGASAVEAIAALRPDVVLLDVQMPELDGFEVLQALETETIPDVVFVTAHDRYAMRAFDEARLEFAHRTLDRAAEAFRVPGGAEQKSQRTASGIVEVRQIESAPGRFAQRLVFLRRPACRRDLPGIDDLRAAGLLDPVDLALEGLGAQSVVENDEEDA